MTGNESSRRQFLKVLAATAAVPAVIACTGCSGGSGGFGAPESFGTVAAGAVSALSVGSLKIVTGQPVCIGRDSSGVYAMTLTCTHAGCDMASDGTVSSTGLFCNCHGSGFDVNGNVTRGPADSPLQHYAVTADSSENLSIHGDQPVTASARLVV
jgi:Rieske Fe-S protein